MKILECSRCHRMFKSTDEHIFIHTKKSDYNWCQKCTRRALELMDSKLDAERDMKLNSECMKCPMKNGCLAICATQPEDVMHPPCEKYAIGIVADRNDMFWTRPAAMWEFDRFNTKPEDLRFVIVPPDESSEVYLV